MKNFDVKGYVSELSDEELVGEVLSWEFSANTTNEELLAAVKKNKISCFFANSLPLDKINFLKTQPITPLNNFLLLHRTRQLLT